MSHKKWTPRQLAAHRGDRARGRDDVLAGDTRAQQEHAGGRRGQRRSAGILAPIQLPRAVDETPIPRHVAALIERARERIQAFQDRWDQPQIEQFVASDFELVYRVLAWLIDRRLLAGRRMLEWGCGFAVVASLASRLGLDATGIEAEPRLLEEACQTIVDFASPVELVHGNFLPPGAEALSPRADFPSLGHRVRCGYEQIGADVDDFSLVFGYPWPGEWEFHQRVFARYGAVDAVLVLFCGPHDIRLWRRT